MLLAGQPIGYNARMGTESRLLPVLVGCGDEPITTTSS